MNSKALTRAAAITIAWIGVATICSELFSAFKESLTLIGGHHWIGKSLLSLVFFGLFYLLFSKRLDDRLTLRDTWWLAGTVLVSGSAILIFYVNHA